MIFSAIPVTIQARKISGCRECAGAEKIAALFHVLRRAARRIPPIPATAGAVPGSVVPEPVASRPAGVAGRGEADPRAVQVGGE